MKKISNNELKKYSKLLKKKYRNRLNLVLVEGSRLIEQLVDNNIPIEHLLITKNFEPDNSLINNYKFIKKVSLINDIELNRLSSTKNPQPIVAIIKKQSIKISKSDFLLYLDDIHDPGNLGTIIRTSAAAGISGIVLSENCCDLFNPKVIRASMGMIFSFPIETKNFDWLKEQNSEIIVTALKESKNIYNWKKKNDKIILVIGSEAHGISDKIMNIANSRIKIPLHNNVESLNAAIASGIALFTMKFLQNN